MALTNEQIKIRERIDNLLQEMPFYVVEYVQEKENEHDFSINTLLEYLYHFKDFFDWLRLDSKIVEANSNKDIKLHHLDDLRKNDVKLYFEMKKHENIASSNAKEHGVVETRKTSSQNAIKSALRSLFRYLEVETENSNGDTYIERNVMAKFPLKRESIATSERAARINKNLLKGSKIAEFLQFVEYEYENTIADSPRKLGPFKRDKLRDLAILHLILGSGIRVAEVATLELTALDLHEGKISLKRKGGNIHNIPIMVEAVLALERYLAIREINYPGAKYSPFVFVVKKKPISEISRRSIQSLVEKYTKAFTGDVKGLYPHKLRHSFALEYRRVNNDIQMLSQQLGHTNLNTTQLYVNMSDAERIAALEKVSQNRNGDN